MCQQATIILMVGVCPKVEKRESSGVPSSDGQGKKSKGKLNHDLSRFNLKIYPARVIKTCFDYHPNGNLTKGKNQFRAKTVLGRAKLNFMRE